MLVQDSLPPRLEAQPWAGAVICPELHQHVNGTGTHLQGVGWGWCWAEGAGSKMHLLIKTGCVHHRPAQPEEGQGWRMGEIALALVSEPGPSTRRLFFNIALGSSGETRLTSLHAAPRGPHAKESHAPGLFSNQTNLQSFDFK